MRNSETQAACEHEITWPGTATGGRGLKTGDLVRVPAGTGKRTAVVETVSLNGLRFTDTTGTRHSTAVAELVPARTGA